MIKLSRLVNPDFLNAFQKVLKSELPLAAAYKVRKISKKLQEELDQFNTIKKELVEKYCAKDADGKPALQEDGGYKVEQDQIEALNKDLIDLLDADIDFPELDVKELGTKLEVSAQDLMVLEGVVKFED